MSIGGLVYSGGGNWGTEVACAADSGFEFTSESIKPAVTLIPNNGITGTISQQPGVKGNELHAGDITVIPDYNYIDRFLALVFGVGTKAEGPTWYLQSLSPPPPDHEGKHGTLVIGHTGLYVRAMPTVKFTGFTLTATPDSIPEFVFHCVANRQIVDDSGTNTLATQTNITRVNPGGGYIGFVASFNDLQICLKARSAAALSYTTDAVYVDNFTMTVNNNMREASVTTRNAPYVDEPLRDGFMTASGSMTFSALTANTYVLADLAKTAQKMYLKFETAANEYSIEFKFASLQFEDVDSQIGGPGLAPHTVNWTAHRPLASPPGFVGNEYKSVPVCYIRNKQNRNALDGV